MVISSEKYSVARLIICEGERETGGTQVPGSAPASRGGLGGLGRALQSRRRVAAAAAAASTRLALVPAQASSAPPVCVQGWGTLVAWIWSGVACSCALAEPFCPLKARGRSAGCLQGRRQPGCCGCRLGRRCPCPMARLPPTLDAQQLAASMAVVGNGRELNWARMSAAAVCSALGGHWDAWALIVAAKLLV